MIDREAGCVAGFFMARAMFMETGEMKLPMDYRWCLLMGLALLLIAGGLAQRYLGMGDDHAKAAAMPKPWLELALTWEPDGKLGQGIYAVTGKEERLAAVPVEAVEVGDPVEPRLAVFTGQPMDLNKIDFDTLRVLKGVGPKMAAAIIAYRRKHGVFCRIEELLEIKGIGPAKFELLRRNLAVRTTGNLSGAVTK